MELVLLLTLLLPLRLFFFFHFPAAVSPMAVFVVAVTVFVFVVVVVFVFVFDAFSDKPSRRLVGRGLRPSGRAGFSDDTGAPICTPPPSSAVIASEGRKQGERCLHDPP